MLKRPVNFNRPGLNSALSSEQKKSATDQQANIKLYPEWYLVAARILFGQRDYKRAYGEVI